MQRGRIKQTTQTHNSISTYMTKDIHSNTWEYKFKTLKRGSGVRCKHVNIYTYPHRDIKEYFERKEE